MTELELKKVALHAIENNKNVIEAIKEFRSKTLFSLKDSKFYIEKYQKETTCETIAEINSYKENKNNGNSETEKLICPRCNSYNVTRKEVGKNNSGWLWPMIIIFSILGISINPFILVLALLSGIVNFIFNFIEKKNDRKKWSMHCNICHNEFQIEPIKNTIKH